MVFCISLSPFLFLSFSLSLELYVALLVPVLKSLCRFGSLFVFSPGLCLFGAQGSFWMGLAMRIELSPIGSKLYCSAW